MRRWPANVALDGLRSAWFLASPLSVAIALARGGISFQTETVRQTQFQSQAR